MAVDVKGEEEEIAQRVRSDSDVSNTSDEIDIEAQPPSPAVQDGGDEKSPQTQLRRTASRASSFRNPVEIVPRSQRRGILAHLAIIPEVTVPTDYTNSVKWSITAIVGIAAAAAPMGSAIILPALMPIAKDLNTTPTITNLSVALYMLAMSIFPLWWSSFSETLGRRTIYIVSFALFIVFGILSAVASNIAMLIVMRMLSGGAAASVQAVGAGTIADLWEPRERGRAMGLFYLGPLSGPMIAPVLGGVMAERLGWRSTLWFLTVFGLLLEIALIVCLPETLKKRRSVVAEAEREAINASDGRPASLQRATTRQSVQIRTKKWLAVLRRCFVDPLKIILLLRFPAVAITVYYASITFGSLYFLNISIETTFSESPYNFSTTLVGLLYIPNSLGYFLSSILGGKWIDYIMHREAKRAGRYHPDGSGRLIFRPEDRMRENAWLGAFLFPAALIWYGWSAQFHTHWIVPMIANFFFGCGSMIVFAMATTMLTEFLPGRASMGIAVNNFIRNIFSCVGGVIAGPLITAIGNGWLCTILALLCLVSGIAVIASMKAFGPRWREKMMEELKEW
ncbi:major facilitator superfamily transporter multidrug resistance [Rhizodiscina lignyota]|uniref:Major facilitator superfamily transporter multidrug resistance n=1 Tax=Rhizodiscina lignyota TaxID=1504668 RepID=A0A9P4M1R7_9PEZI|nr:major facilitator superfamily transporter multidrug resistance [Rhizodiscina lignyota]